MGEGVVDAGLVAVGEVVGAAVEEVVVGAGGHEFEVAVGGFEEPWFVLGEEDVGGVAAVAGAASPTRSTCSCGSPRSCPRRRRGA